MVSWGLFLFGGGFFGGVQAGFFRLGTAAGLSDGRTSWLYARADPLRFRPGTPAMIYGLAHPLRVCTRLV